MLEGLNKILTYSETQGKNHIYRDGFVFTAVTEPANIYDGIVIRFPETAKAYSPQYGFSNKSLKEHIDFINDNNLEKAVIIADSIDFITQCPCLKCLRIFPSDCAENNFDYSPLYNMPNIEYLECRTMYDLKEDKSATVDYSQITGLKHLTVCGEGHRNIKSVKALETLSIHSCKSLNSLDNICGTESLEKLDIIQCGLQSLSGIENMHCVQKLRLAYNRSLQDINGLEKVRAALKSLTVQNCSKISDFSVLEKLENLEHLELYGNNELKDLSFLNNLKNLKFFVFSMNVLDGDLTPCLNVEYARSEKNRKHYNLKDKDLPKKLQL